MIRYVLRHGRRRGDDRDWDRPDDRFLPLRATDLVKSLVARAEKFNLTSDQVQRLAENLQHLFDQEVGSVERRLMDRYAPFNPDRDTAPRGTQEAADDRAYEEFHDYLAYLLDKANYEQLNDVQIEQAVLQARSRRLSVRVDPDRVERLEVWIRGQGTSHVAWRPWWSPWRIEYEEVPIFRRLVIVARLKGLPHVIIKAFKEIPESDVKALLPHAEVTMSLIDRIKLFGTSAGTLGLMITKLVKLLATFAAIWYLAWIVLLGLATLGVRALLGYRHARTRRDWQRTRHLYFQNLGNNASALQMIVATLKQEELKETLLAYLFCVSPPMPSEGEESADTERNIQQEIEHFLQEEYGMQIKFDWPDAEQKLATLDLWRNQSQHEVYSINHAIERLHALWITRRGQFLEPTSATE